MKKIYYMLLIALTGSLLGVAMLPAKEVVAEPVKQTDNKLRDYQLDIVEGECYIYDGNRLVGKCQINSNLIEQLIVIDNR